MYLIYSPVAFALAVWDRESLRRGLKSAFLLTLGCLCVVLPWTAYLSSREGHFVLLCTNDGTTLSGGLNPTLAAMEGYEVPLHPRGPPILVGPWKLDPPRADRSDHWGGDREAFARGGQQTASGAHQDLGVVPSPGGRLPYGDEALIHVGDLSLLVEHVLVPLFALQRR